MSLSHTQAQKLIRQFAGGSRDPFAEDDLAEHLDLCPECRAYAQSLALFEGQLSKSLKSHWPRPVLSSYTVRQYAGGIQQQAELHRREQRLNLFWRSLVFSGAAVAIVWLLFWFGQNNLLPTQPLFPAPAGTPAPMVVSTALVPGPTPTPKPTNSGQEREKYIPFTAPSARMGYPMPLSGEVITLENVLQLKPLALWGQDTYFDMTMSPNGRFIAASAPLEGRIYFYDAVSLEDVGWLDTEKINCTYLAFSPDSARLAVATIKTIQVWQLPEKTLLFEKSFEQGGPVVFSPDGKTLASANLARIALWNLQGNLVKHIDIQGPIYNLVFSPDGQSIASSNENGEVVIYDVQNGNNILSLNAEPGWVSGLAFSPDGSALATGSTNIHLWQLPEGEFISEIPLKDPILDLVFSPDGDYFASGGFHVDIWQVSNGKRVFTLPSASGYARDLAFTADGEHLVFRAGNKIERWQTSDWSRVAYSKQPLRQTNTFALSPDGQILATGSEDDGVQLWRVEDGTLLTSYLDPYYELQADQQVETIEGGFGPITAVVFSPDGVHIAYASEKGAVRVRNLVDGSPHSYSSIVKGAFYSLAFSADSRYVASGASNGEVHLWSLDDSNGNDIIKTHMGAIKSLDFSPDGTLLAVGAGRETILLYRLDDMTQPISKWSLGIATKVSVVSLKFSPDSKTIAASFEDGAYPELFDLEGNSLQLFEGVPMTEFRLAFSPDGQILAYGPWLFKVTDGEVLGVLPTRAEHVIFTYDGRAMITSAPGGVWWWGIR